MVHDPHNPSLEISARNSGHACQPRSHTEFAGFENALGVDLRFTSKSQYFFITSTFTLVQQPPAQPPNQRMKPENSFHHHVQRGSQIIAAPHVPNFVSENSIQVRILEVL